MSATAGAVADILRGAAAELADFLADRATVYQINPTTRQYTVVARTDLPCSLQSVNVQPAQSGGVRDEFSRRRTLYWAGDYAMPPDVRMQVNGTADRYSVTQGTVVGFPAGGTPPVYYRADLVRQQGAA